MTSKDKTSDKLLASVRKSKTGTVARKTSEQQNVGKSAAKSKAPTKSAPTKPKAPTKSKAPAAKSASGAETNQNRDDGFSLGRRVWPD